MPKKSRKTAARYSELSKARKKKQRAKPSLQTQTVSVSTLQGIAESKPAKEKAVRQPPRVQPELKRGFPRYEYVRADLKRIGVLAAAMILVLIILSFVLG
jgi:hypothetical protein